MTSSDSLKSEEQNKRHPQLSPLLLNVSDEVIQDDNVKIINERITEDAEANSRLISPKKHLSLSETNLSTYKKKKSIPFNNATNEANKKGCANSNVFIVDPFEGNFSSVRIYSNEYYNSSESTSRDEDRKCSKNNERLLLSQSSSTVCRICHTNAAKEKLLSPCYCKGSLAHVHLSCLEKWLNQSSRSYCELCMYQYNAVETLRYGFFEGIRLWTRHPRNRNHVRADLTIGVLLTLVTIGIFAVCLMAIEYFVIEGLRYGISRSSTVAFVGSFLAVILTGYLVTMYLLIKDELIPWYNWWKNTLNIKLLLSPSVLQTQST